MSLGLGLEICLCFELCLVNSDSGGDVVWDGLGLGHSLSLGHRLRVVTIIVVVSIIVVVVPVVAATIVAVITTATLVDNDGCVTPLELSVVPAFRLARTIIMLRITVTTLQALVATILVRLIRHYAVETTELVVGWSRGGDGGWSIGSIRGK